MRLDRLDVYYVAMPLIYPWRTAYGEDYDIHSVLIKGTSGDCVAWTETTPFFAPTYLTESAGSAFHHITQVFGPHVVGRHYETAAELDQHLGIFKGNSFAKAAVEMQWWALESERTGTPIHRLLGGQTRDVVAGADFGIQDSFDMLLGNIQGAVDAGFPRIKLKAAPGWDLEMLKAVYGAFPNTTFHIDCNSGYTLDDLPFFKAIDDLGLAFIEQPLAHDDILDHAELARQIQTPICLDETIVSLRTAEQALRLNACQYINIKPGRIGGFSTALAVHDKARNAGVPVWIGGMLESAVGASLCIELATLDNFSYPGDLFPSSRFYHQDLADPALELSDELTFAPFTGPRPVPVPERLEQMTRMQATVVPEGAG
ncbi:MAG: o-succinylbenzoate synthase [Candidatus Latescibacteria bacterium]|nr:o-succinylbenzoate synthase [Candidatus Latescibacterota bacterium]